MDRVRGVRWQGYAFCLAFLLCRKGWGHLQREVGMHCLQANGDIWVDVCGESQREQPKET